MNNMISPDYNYNKEPATPEQAILPVTAEVRKFPQWMTQVMRLVPPAILGGLVALMPVEAGATTGNVSADALKLANTPVPARVAPIADSAAGYSPPNEEISRQDFHGTETAPKEDPAVEPDKPVSGGGGETEPIPVGTVKGTVIPDALNIRSIPSTDGAIQGSLVNEIEVVAIGRNEAGTWLKLDLGNDATGWVFAAFVALNGDKGALPIVDQPEVTEAVAPGTTEVTPATTEPAPGQESAALQETVSTNKELSPAELRTSLEAIIPGGEIGPISEIYRSENVVQYRTEVKSKQEFCADMFQVKDDSGAWSVQIFITSHSYAAVLAEASADLLTQGEIEEAQKHITSFSVDGSNAQLFRALILGATEIAGSGNNIDSPIPNSPYRVYILLRGFPISTFQEQGDGTFAPLSGFSIAPNGSLGVEYGEGSVQDSAGRSFQIFGGAISPLDGKNEAYFAMLFLPPGAERTELLANFFAYEDVMRIMAWMIQYHAINSLLAQNSQESSTAMFNRQARDNPPANPTVQAWLDLMNQLRITPITYDYTPEKNDGYTMIHTYAFTLKAPFRFKDGPTVSTEDFVVIVDEVFSYLVDHPEALEALTVEIDNEDMPIEEAMRIMLIGMKPPLNFEFR